MVQNVRDSVRSYPQVPVLDYSYQVLFADSPSIGSPTCVLKSPSNSHSAQTPPSASLVCPSNVAPMNLRVIPTREEPESTRQDLRITIHAQLAFSTIGPDDIRGLQRFRTGGSVSRGLCQDDSNSLWSFFEVCRLGREFNVNAT